MTYLDINLIANIIDFDSTILYNFLCVNKYTSIELLNNITFLCLPNNNELIDDNLKLLKRLKVLILDNNDNISNNGLQYIKNIHTLKLDSKKITDEGLKIIHNLSLNGRNIITNNGLQYIKNIHTLNLNKKFFNKIIYLIIFSTLYYKLY